MAKVDDIVEEVKSQQLTSAELSKVAEGIEEEGDVVRQHEECARQQEECARHHEACARQHEECARQLKCAAFLFCVTRTLNKAGATERQMECIGRHAFEGCLEELPKDA